MAVPYTFGSATSSIPLSQLDSNFATTITLGNTAIQLGNTVTTLNNMTLANVTVSSGNATVTNANVTTLTATNDASISGLTVGKGGGALSTNSAVGVSALNATNTGSLCTAFGYQALKLTTGKECTAVGANAGASMTSGEALTALGYNAANLNTGNSTTALGHNALGSNTTGDQCTAVGSAALIANTTGSYNVAMGRQALVASTATSNCTAIGYQAGSGLSGSAGGFTSIGYQSGNNFTNGFNSTFVGNGAQAGAPTGNNEIVICTSGQTGKGTSTGFIAPSTGGVYQGNNSSSWSTTSDQRLKKNIVDNTEGLDVISQIRVRNFEYRTAEEVTELPAHTVIDKQGVQLGVIAQELREVCPDCVKEESTGVISVDSDNIFWHMVNAIKDLKTELDTVKAELAALKG